MGQNNVEETLYSYSVLEKMRTLTISTQSILYRFKILDQMDITNKDYRILDNARKVFWAIESQRKSLVKELTNLHRLVRCSKASEQDNERIQSINGIIDNLERIRLETLCILRDNGNLNDFPTTNILLPNCRTIHPLITFVEQASSVKGYEKIDAPVKIYSPEAKTVAKEFANAGKRSIIGGTALAGAGVFFALVITGVLTAGIVYIALGVIVGLIAAALVIKTHEKYDVMAPMLDLEKSVNPAKPVVSAGTGTFFAPESDGNGVVPPADYESLLKSQS